VSTPAAPSPEDAADCVTCLGCLAWPRVTRMKASKHGYWPAQFLVACDVCTREPSTGYTRAAAVAEWNDRNARLGGAEPVANYGP